MTVDQEIAKVASLIGDETRSAILIALMEGKALTAGELAFRANISPQTASNHLKKLMEASLIEYIKTPTRYRYYKITSPLVAKALESLSVLLPQVKKPPPRHDKLNRDICLARTCYDHLAGTLGVRITQALVENAWLDSKNNTFVVTQTGKSIFSGMNINCEMLIKQKRQFATPCLDWTEREYHLSGSLGTALLAYLFDNHLLIPSRKQPRVVSLTQKGIGWLKQNLGISLAEVC